LTSSRVAAWHQHRAIADGKIPASCTGSRLATQHVAGRGGDPHPAIPGYTNNSGRTRSSRRQDHGHADRLTRRWRPARCGQRYSRRYASPGTLNLGFIPLSRQTGQTAVSKVVRIHQRTPGPTITFSLSLRCPRIKDRWATTEGNVLAQPAERTVPAHGSARAVSANRRPGRWTCRRGKSSPARQASSCTRRLGALVEPAMYNITVIGNHREGSPAAGGVIRWGRDVEPAGR